MIEKRQTERISKAVGVVGQKGEREGKGEERKQSMDGREREELAAEVAGAGVGRSKSLHHFGRSCCKHATCRSGSSCHVCSGKANTRKNVCRAE